MTDEKVIWTRKNSLPETPYSDEARQKAAIKRMARRVRNLALKEKNE